MIDDDLPDLTFPTVSFGALETPWDLRPLLYVGAAGSNVRTLADRIAQGAFGDPMGDRLPLATKIHDVISGRLTGGARRRTLRDLILTLRRFFDWVDKEQHVLSLETLESVFLAWISHQRELRATERRSRDAADLARLFDEVLETPGGLLSKARIPYAKKGKPVLGVKADKQNLEDTFAFGHALMDIVSALSLEAVQGGNLPVPIPFRNGKVFEHWSRLKRPEKVKSLTGHGSLRARKTAVAKRLKYAADTSLRTRYPLVNLRISAELLIFIAQTGMNISQAIRLRLTNFRYESSTDGYRIYRTYKERKQGEVLFEIYRDYRTHFESYLVWRKTIFPGDDDGFLFPLNRRGALQQSDLKFENIRAICEFLGIPFITPSMLRNTRINWILRRSRDPAMTAEMHAHTQKILINRYEQPSLQVAMVEVARFHAAWDPAIALRRNPAANPTGSAPGSPHPGLRESRGMSAVFASSRYRQPGSHLVDGELSVSQIVGVGGLLPAGAGNRTPPGEDHHRRHYAETPVLAGEQRHSGRVGQGGGGAD
jgi:integrase